MFRITGKLQDGQRFTYRSDSDTAAEALTSAATALGAHARQIASVSVRTMTPKMEKSLKLLPPKGVKAAKPAKAKSAK